MNRRHSFNLGIAICLIFAAYAIYYLLLSDSCHPLSIDSVTSQINDWASHSHIILFGLLPIYLALIIFGIAMVGIYVGSLLQRWLNQLL